MRKLTFLLVILIQTISSAQNKDEMDILIELGKQTAIYNNQRPSKLTPESVINKLAKNNNENCQFAIDFTLETLKENNNLMSDKYLIKPSKEILIQICAIELAAGFSHMYEGEQLKNQIEYNLKNYPAYQSYNQLLDTYYNVLFTAYGNRSGLKGFTGKNIDLNKYNLNNNAEKAIFYFRVMRYISHNVIFPILTNTEIVKSSCTDFNKFPTINNKKFYSYMDFDFEDFPSRISDFNGSYKHFYINETFNEIFVYIKCQEKNFIPKDEISNVIKSSILSNKNLYKYCEKKETLEKILNQYSSK